MKGSKDDQRMTPSLPIVILFCQWVLKLVVYSNASTHWVVTQDGRIESQVSLAGKILLLMK